MKHVVPMMLLAQIAMWSVLPVRATDISSVGSGNWTAGATWSSNPSVPGAGDNVTIQAGHTVTMPDTTQRTVSNLTVNGTLTHALDMKIDLVINGDLTVSAGGAIDVSEKSGLTTGAGDSYTGGSYGGLGGNQGAYKTYGSITNPVHAGSWGRSNYGYGGGLAILSVAGATTLNGYIRADGKVSIANDHGAGSGGGINLTTGTLVGSGTNSACGATNVQNAVSGGGGGRIAVKLTAGNDFGNVVIRAHNGRDDGGGAGTVYLQTAAQGYGNGTLIVDNGGQPTNNLTLISTNVAGADVGSVVVWNGGRLFVDSGYTLRLRSAFTNDCQTNNLGGTVIVDGSGTCTLSGTCGTNAFRNLTCTNADKQITFKAGNLYMVTNLVALRGTATDHPVVLRSASPGSAWKLQIPVNDHTFRYVDVQDSDARPGQPVQAADSTDRGNNSNWVFSVTGSQNIWTGASDTNWANGANWSLGHEVGLGEVALIPAGPARQPALSGDKVVSSLQIEGGASLSLNGRSLTVKDAFTVVGTVRTTGGEQVAVQGSADLTGGTIEWTPGTVFRLTGTGAQTITVDGDVFRQLTVENSTGPVAFAGSLTATGLTCQAAGATMVFQAGATYAVENLTLHGREASKITLRSSSPGTKWNLNVTGRARVAAVNVADSDADGGLAIYPVMSINSGANNDNWVFGTDVWKRWSGGSSAAWGTAGNWAPAGVPAATNRVWIDGNSLYAPVIGSALTVTQLVVGGSASAMLTFDSTATLTVVNDVEVWNGGTITHNVTDGSTPKYVTLSVGGNLVIDAGGAIDVSEKSGLTTGAGDNWTGGSYGGLGGNQGAYKTYGSITNPVHAGSWGRSSYGYGGGLAMLAVAGATTLNGSLRADGKVSIANDHGAGSGGGINLTTGTLTGSGTSSACGATNIPNAASGGGGGRIAVKLTAGNDFGDVAVRAHNGGDDRGGAGTIYLQTAGQGYGNGTLLVDNGGQSTNNLTLVSTNMPAEAVGDVVVTNAARLAIANGQTLTINGSLLDAASAVIWQTNSTCVFGATNTAWVTGNHTFGNLACTARDKTILFKAGSTNVVAGVLTLNGPTMKSTAPGESWYLTLAQTGAVYQAVQRVYVQDSNAGGGAQIVVKTGGINLGRNVNWKFTMGTVLIIR